MTGILQGKIALITGGCSGIGAGTAEVFLREGARIIVADLQALPENFRAAEAAGRLHYQRCNVTIEGDIRDAVDAAQRVFGGLDILFNNAGSSGTQASIADMVVEDWDAAMALLVRSGMLGMKHALPLLRARGGGSIINTASIAGMRPGISAAAYSTAKAAVIHLTKIAALEFAPDNIRVNAVCPGIIPTPAYGQVFGVPREVIESVLPRIAEITRSAQPLRRAGSVEDIGRMVAFLASDAAIFTTGQEFAVDGGMVLMEPGSMEMGRADGLLARLGEFGQQMTAKHTAR